MKPATKTRNAAARVTLTFDRSELVAGRIVCWVSSANNGEHFGIVYTDAGALGGWEYKGKSALLEPQVQKALNAVASYCAAVYGSSPKELREYRSTVCRIERGEAIES